MRLVTDRLFLCLANLPMLEAAVRQDPAALSELLGGATPVEYWTHFPEALAWMRDHLREHPDEGNWWTYLILHRHDNCLIGTCGYKGPPTPEGAVEIGYEIADSYQGRGFATEAARTLLARARAQERVRIVRAHTLPEENASVAILRKLGFEFKGPVTDPEDGEIWRWEILLKTG